MRNEDRSLGARLAGELALLRRRQPPDRNPTFASGMRGTAGQSFGAFATEGMSLVLEGQANDLRRQRPFRRRTHPAHVRASWLAQPTPQVIMGNVALYGATAGLLFAAGSAGERFAIRNSGATAVVEGVGEHGCEYMTGGAVVVLGPTGRNFGAGMTGGMAFVWDPDGNFVAGQKFHPEFVEVLPLTDCNAAEQASVGEMLRQHVSKTASGLGASLLASWPETLPRIVRVTPRYESAS